MAGSKIIELLRTPFDEWEGWQQYIAIVLFAIVMVFAAVLSVIVPIVLAAHSGNSWYLLWLCIPAGVFGGTMFFIDEV